MSGSSSQHSWRDLPPETLIGGRYRIQELIGRGGSSQVFRALDQQVGRTVALKLLRGWALAPETDRRRLQREADALRRLEHPGIVGLLGYGQDGRDLYLVLDLVEGESLGRRLKQRGLLDVDEAIDLGWALCEALDHAHSRGVLHRDLKPGNVLLDTRAGGRPRLTDFGLARDVDPDAQSTLTSEGDMIGTPGYWAPELASGDLERIGIKSDVYGLGAILYAGLTGEVPQGRPTTLGRAIAKSFRPARPARELRPAIPAALDAVLRKALAPDPDDRYPTIAAFGEALAAVDQPSGSRVWRPWAALALAAFGLGLLITVGLLLRSQGAPADPPPAPTLASSPPLSPAATPSPASSLPDGEPWWDPISRQIDGGDPQGALAWLRASGDQLRPRARRLSLEGSALLALGQADEAIPLLSQAFEAEPSSWTSAPLAVALLRLGRLEEGLAVLREARSAAPLEEQWQIAKNEVSLLVGAGRLRQALARLAELDRQPPSPLAPGPKIEIELGYARGFALHGVGRFDEALAAFDRALGLDPEHYLCHQGRAVLLQSLGRHAEALAAFERTRELRDDNPDVVARQGASLFALGKAQAATALLRTGLNRWPRHGRMLGNMAAVTHAAGRSAEALELFQRRLAVEPGEVSAHHGKGVVLLDLERLPAARDAFLAGLQVAPNHAGCLQGLAEVLLTAGQTEQAIELATRALASDADYTPAWRTRGKARLKLGQTAAAAEDFRSGLRRAPARDRPGLEKLLQLATGGS